MPPSPEYYQKNKKAIIEASKQKYLKDPQKFLTYQKEYRKKNKALISQKLKNKRYKVLIEAIEFLGGECNKCKQKFDPVCYDFHHVDPNNKEFTIGDNMLLAKHRIQKEVEKCILLCANCHRLTHKELKNDTQ